MSKIIVFDREAKEKLQAGVDKLVKAVTSTLGPHGRNVVIEKEYGNPHSTKDGVTVAKSITLKDPIENIGAQMVKQASIKTAEQAGDGTTTSTLLAGALVEEGLKAIRTGVNAVEVKKGMEAACKAITAELKNVKQDIVNDEQIKQVATISANNDIEIGNLVAAAMEKVGRDGIVTVEESRSGETSLEVVEGLQFDRGYKSPYFVTDNNTMSAILDEPYVLIYDSRITQVKDLLPLLERVSSESKSLLIIAEDIDGEALATMVMNKARGALKVCAVKAPDFGDRRLQILEDIATLTGGTVVSKTRGMSLAKMDMSFLGKSRIVTVSRDTTTIVDGKGKEDEIMARIEAIKKQIEKTDSNYEIEKLQERLGKMVGGVAIINVGGANEIEIKEKKDRIDDALQATKAALEEGIVPGSGTVLIAIKNKVQALTTFGVRDFILGQEIVFNAISQPFIKILENAGIDPSKHLYCPLLTSESAYDINKKEFVNAFENGIIDPAKVTRCALENAVAVAGSILITECVVHEEPTEKKDTNNDLNNYGI
jgi:chaperonin GroEL